MAEKHSKKEVIRHIKEQLDSGQSFEKIRAHLLSYGHTEEEIDRLLDEVLRHEEKTRSRTVSRAVEILYVVIFVIFIFWVGASARSPGETVIFGFSPTLLFIIITIIVLDRFKRSDNVLLTLPIAMAFLFFIMGSIGNMPPFSQMEIGKLTVLNLILSYIFLFALKYSELVSRIDFDSFFGDMLSKQEEKLKEEGEMQERREERMKIESPPKPEEYVEIKQPEDEKESIPKLIHSIESNCKTMNSVIGRVYRKSNGGTTLMRDLIEVRKEWYNEFNELVKTMDKERILQVIDKIEKRLNSMFRTEKELFGNTSLRNLKRDAQGNSRIIDVLIMNDNDPVETYFENALILCGQIREKIFGNR